MIASHYPILLDEDTSELAVFTHVGRPDEESHGFGDHEILVIVQGPTDTSVPAGTAPGASNRVYMRLRYRSEFSAVVSTVSPA